jgi:carbon monoxide dehydrogenase subunit G
LKLKFDVTVQLVEVNPPSQIKAVMDGKPMKLAGKLSGSVALSVSAVDEQTTRIQYVLDQSITGKLGGIGQSVFRAKCEEMGSLFAENLSQRLTSSQEAML